MSSTDEITKAVIPFDKLINSIRDSRMNLIILPTDWCNFRCIYCYEKYEKGVMEDHVVNGIKNLIRSKMATLSDITISWFGGEPLLAYNRITEIMTFLQRLNENYNNIKVSSTMTTNGSLLRVERLANLVNLGVTNYQISFDGDRELHDKFRLRLGGGASFDAIFSNLISAHKTDLPFEISIRIHVNSENKESLKAFLRRCKKQFDSDKRFKFYIRQLSKLGGENDSDLPVLGDKALEPVRELKEYCKSLGLSLFTLSQPHICYASELNSLVIRKDGGVSKCTVALYNERNFVGKLNDDGTVTLDKNKIKFWSRGIYTGSKVALACPAIGMNSKNGSKKAYDLFLQELAAIETI